MTVAIILIIVAVIAIVWAACYKKAKREAIIDELANSWESEATKENIDNCGSNEELCSKNTLVADDTPKQPELPKFFTTAVNGAELCASDSSVTIYENCKSVDFGAEKPEQTDTKKVTKKPRKTQLERTDAAIAKLEGQIGRRSTLLKQLKKPVTKDERLNKWKGQLKQMKALRKDLLKAAKTPKPRKA